MRAAVMFRSALSRRTVPHSARSFHPANSHLQQQQQRGSGSPHGNFYRTHGRALFKALTLAFFSYQCFYWAWITLETEELKDGKNQEIKSLEGEIRLLDEGRNSHKPGEALKKDTEAGKRLLEEKQG